MNLEGPRQASKEGHHHHHIVYALLIIICNIMSILQGKIVGRVLVQRAKLYKSDQCGSGSSICLNVALKNWSLQLSKR